MEKKNLRPRKEDVRDISEKIESYLNIVNKTTRDMVPKAITLYIIEELKAFIDKELLSLIFNDSIDHYVCFSTDNHINFIWTL